MMSESKSIRIIDKYELAWRPQIQQSAYDVIFNYYITLEATNPAGGSCLTFQVRLFRDNTVKGAYHKIMTEGCRIKPEIPGQFCLLCHVIIAFSVG